MNEGLSNSTSAHFPFVSLVDLNSWETLSRDNIAMKKLFTTLDTSEYLLKLDSLQYSQFINTRCFFVILYSSFLSYFSLLINSSTIWYQLSVLWRLSVCTSRWNREEVLPRFIAQLRIVCVLGKKGLIANNIEEEIVHSKHLYSLSTRVTHKDTNRSFNSTIPLLSLPNWLKNIPSS